MSDQYTRPVTVSVQCNTLPDIPKERVAAAIQSAMKAAWDKAIKENKSMVVDLQNAQITYTFQCGGEQYVGKLQSNGTFKSRKAYAEV